MENILPSIVVVIVKNYLSYLVVLILFFASFLYIIIRSKSFYFLKYKIFNSCVGAKTISDSVIDGYIKDINDIASFNYFTSLNISSRRKIRRLISWAEYYGVANRDFKTIKPYFNFEETRFIKKPKKKFVKLMCLGFIFLTIIYYSFLYYIQSKMGYAWLHFIHNGQYFIINHYEAYLSNVFLMKEHFYPLTPKLCTSMSIDKISKITGFYPNNINDICTSLKTSGLNVQVDRTVRFQKYFLIWFVVVCVSFLFFWMIKIIRMKQACEIYEHVTSMDKTKYKN